MKYDDLTIQKLRELSILEVADKLGFKLKDLGDEGRRALCPYHDDKHPSLHFSKKKGIFKCFVCGAKGDLFKLVMDDRNCTFPEACEWLINEFHVVVIDNCPADCSATLRSSVEEMKEIKEMSLSENATRSQISAISFISAGPKITSAICPLPSDIVQRSLSVDSVFCQSVVSAGYLSQGQIVSAANRYRLGSSKEGGVIFWEIDAQQQVHTGKIMYYQSDCHRDKQHPPTWVHSLMKSQLPADYELQHCLFGLHLLTSAISSTEDRSVAVQSAGQKIAIVESEKTAVILSEIVKDFIWMSCGGLQMFKPELLAPLVNHKVVVFPDTDETGEAYNAWLTVLQQAAKLYPFKHPLRISNLLEFHATPEQKQRKIDIVDFLFEVPQI